MEAVKVVPQGERLLIKRDTADEKRVGSIILPASVVEKPQTGEIRATGTGKERPDGTVRPPIFRAGQRVLFGKYSGVDIEIESEPYVVLKEEDVIAVLY